MLYVGKKSLFVL